MGLAEDATAQYNEYVNAAFAAKERELAAAEDAIEQLRISNNDLRAQRDAARESSQP